MSQTQEPALPQSPIGIFGGIRNEHNDYLSVETVGPAVVIKIHNGENKAMFSISHNNLIRSIEDITDELKKCCDRVRSDCAIDV